MEQILAPGAAPATHSAVPLAGHPQLDGVQAALEKATAALRAQQSATGPWPGELSSSALSTATAVTALAVVRREGANGSSQSPEVDRSDRSGGTGGSGGWQGAAFSRSVEVGLAWLAAHQNPDGGWGDTTRSISNISTTTLVWAAFGVVPGADQAHAGTVARAAAWLSAQAGGVSPGRLAPAIIARYGKDRTFSVPILTHCALAGRLGAGREAWRHVIPLPFELAALPHWLFAAARLPVVSYALPALIAIGQVRYHHAPPRNPVSRFLRWVTRARTLRVLTGLQPVNGGFLEATPLTSFVTMSLAGAGLAGHVVARQGVRFLLQSQRPDGCWPIDTNLSTWVTTLAVNALGAGAFSAAGVAAAGAGDAVEDPGHGRNPAVESQSGAGIRDWLLAQQYQVEHPYTHAAPGGWAWTDLPGGVPDADDTAGALVALRALGPVDPATRAAAVRGIEWLLSLQNRDGGIPTFCRGWGALPFDRSSADITAHVVRAWIAWAPDLPASLAGRLERGLTRAVGFLARAQGSDGAWLPLWFGNQRAPDDGNPLYGTTRVLVALAELVRRPGLAAPLPRALQALALSWLAQAQNADGGWGGAAGVESSVEETGLAVEALACSLGPEAPRVDATLLGVWRRGVTWLVRAVDDGRWTEPSPIGFYFAKLWYYERLYPVIFTVSALRRSAEVAGND